MNNNKKKLKLNSYKNYFINFINKHHLKIKILKIITFITVFVLIFDKATILLILYIYNIYIALLSNIFKHPELNLKSYTNIKIDPEKVLFEDNKFLPECCFYNSEYSSSKGCPCITGDQQNYLSARGTNKSYISFIQNTNDYKNKFFSPTLAFQGNNVPFKTNDEKFIIDYEPITPEKKTEFNSLINNY